MNIVNNNNYTSTVNNCGFDDNLSHNILVRSTKAIEELEILENGKKLKWGNLKGGDYGSSNKEIIVSLGYTPDHTKQFYIVITSKLLYFMDGNEGHNYKNTNVLNFNLISDDFAFDQLEVPGYKFPVWMWPTTICAALCVLLCCIVKVVKYMKRSGVDVVRAEMSEPGMDGKDLGRSGHTREETNTQVKSAETVSFNCFATY